MAHNEVIGFLPPEIHYDEKEHKFMDEKEIGYPTGAKAVEVSLDEIGLPVIETKQRRARINPDSIPVLATAVALVTILMVSSFAVSFSGIYEVSAWTGIPKFLQWLPALFIDAAILAYTISLIVFKARGESTWRTTLGLSGFALISVVANASHTLSYWGGDVSDLRVWMGVVITASAPIAVLLASEEITRLAFEPAKGK